MKNLSKSRFTQFKQCSKLMWLSCYKPEEGPIDENTQALFETGKKVGDLAKGLFGKYEDMTCINEAGYPDVWKMERMTKKAMDGGVENICEAAFLDGNNYCAVDILHRVEDGWEIYEVKSSTSVKEINFYDVAYQRYVLEKKGVNVTDVYVVTLNNQYVRHGELDIHQLFTITNVSVYCDDIKEEVEKMVGEANFVLQSSDEPKKDIGMHCTDPYGCAFWDYCAKAKGFPTPSVMDMYRMTTKKKFEYISKKMLSYADLKEEKLSEKQQRQIRCYENGSEEVNKEGIKSFLSTLRYPLYHLDFETMQPAIPEFDGTSPYQQIPFQYSLHIQSSPRGELQHKEFLGISGENPLRAIAESLCDNIPADACVLAYNKSFECSRLKELANLFPDLAEHLTAIASNIKDLLNPFQDGYYYNAAMGGSFSIKSVLPALFPDDPELDYHNLEGDVHNGSEAMNIFPRIQYMPKEEQEKARTSLLKYCELDTYAMVKVLNKLYETVGEDVAYDGENDKKQGTGTNNNLSEEEEAIRNKYRQWKIKKILVDRESIEGLKMGYYDSVIQEIFPDNIADFLQLDDEGFEKEDKDGNSLPIWYDYVLLEAKRCKKNRFALVEVKDIVTEIIPDDDGNVQTYEYDGNTWFKEQVVFVLGEIVEEM